MVTSSTQNQNIEITEIKVFAVHEEKLKAYVTIVLNHSFVIRDLKVIAGTSGLFVAMPSKRRKDGTFKDIAHPVNHLTRELFEKKILEAYTAELSATPETNHTIQSSEKEYSEYSPSTPL